MVSLWLATHFLLKIYFIIDQLASSTFKIPYTVILTLHHRLQSDYNFQDLGCDLLLKLTSNCVFYSMLPVKFLEYTVSMESSFYFQGISVSTFCLLCNRISGLSCPCGLFIWWYFVITSNKIIKTISVLFAVSGS